MPATLSDSPTHLEPPSRTVEKEDPGAGHNTSSASDSDEEHFSDASEGQPDLQTESPQSGRASPIPVTRVERVDDQAYHGELPGTQAYEKRTQDAVPDEVRLVSSDPSEEQSNLQTVSPQSGRTSPIPLTRVERVDDSVQHGEVPGTEAYEKRTQDAVPDEIEIVPDSITSRSPSPAKSPDRPLTPGGSPTPRTVVEKVEPDEPSHGEIPGTEAYEKRRADAVPDIVAKVASNTESTGATPTATEEANALNAESQPVPETRLTRVDTIPAEDQSHTEARAHQSSSSDALPDTVDTVVDEALPAASEADHEPVDTKADDDFGDDFDEFVDEPGGMNDNDDFGDFDDFDDDFQEPEVVEHVADTSTTFSQQPPASISVPPLIDFNDFSSTSELLTALSDTLDDIFPAVKDLHSLPPVEPIPDSSAIFSTERSLSLWSQLVAPPPLQPQNWVKSRIRRLFLVSLGVPVDLDEILPASKQKKLILPSIDIDSSGNNNDQSQPQPRKEGDETPTSGQAPARAKNARRGATPPPQLDLSSVRRLCTTTDAALDGLTDGELSQHVSELEQITLRASSVLEFWLKRRDGLISEKEAFEGVIENLVSHVRRARK
ncbi:hypothetical protein N7539_001461 [Penicillium diatomitis]|uniref:Uncharacterized protein n=1 Tax=Penicillium diatomitis TaxID=2819901 RepID=A0A9X0C045_9EURO|nr:uncharacterized protein N7539_001461 [Penicillium diatomitis]KAJ5492715.1 hypothetical protein N7539_001461 [Penicillium diatomitis]